MTNTTIDPISYNAGIEADRIAEMVRKARKAYDALSPEMKAWHDHEQRRSFVRGSCSSSMDYEEWCKIVDRVIPPLPKPHRTEPQTAPDAEICILCANGNDLPEGETCPGCKRAGHAVGLAAAVIKARGRNEPPSTPVKFGAAPADAERLALADRLAKDIAYDFRMGPVHCFNLTPHERDLIVSSLRAGGWREDMPPVSVGCEREFIVAVYRASSGKAYTFAASYLNAYPLQYEHECPKWKEGVGCSGEGCDDGCPTTGWFEQTGDDDYSSMYNRLELREGDIFLGWSELPKWNGPLPSAPHTDKEG